MSLTSSAATPRPSYRRLLAESGVRRMLAWSVVGRLPLSMFPLGLILLTRASGNGYGSAAIPGACYGVALAVGTPIAGRAVDRHGVRRVLLPRALALAAASGGALACALASGPVFLLAACALLMGAATPPVTAATRAAWRDRVSSSTLLGFALNLDASAHECVFVCGPALVALLSAVDPAVAISAAALAGALGTAGFITTTSGRPEPGHCAHDRPTRTFETVGMRVLFLAAVLLGMAVGLIETSMPAFAERHGDRSLAGLAIACFAVGSALGAVALSGHTHRPAHRRLLLAALALSPAASLLLLAGSIPAMCVVITLAGLPMSTVLSSAYVLVDSLAPASAQTEAFAWLSTALYSGGALGTALAGQLIAWDGPSRSLLGGVTACVGCAAVVLIGLRHLSGGLAPPARPRG